MTSVLPLRALSFLLPIFAGAAALGACGGAGGPGDGQPVELIDNGFESDDPDARNASQATNGAAASADAGTMATVPSEGAAGTSGDAQRAVEEADIIKLDGSRLYALSRYGGLAVIDVSDPDHMHLLGRKRTDGMPFEMYVRNGRAYVMMNDFGRYVRANAGDAYGSWVQTSEIVALDVTNPSAIGEIATYDVPGSIADSRLVGDALYLVTYESGYCWGCQSQPATIVTSFNVAGASIAKVDSLSFGSGNQYSWQRSVAATSERLYIAGPEYSWRPGTTGGNSVIQVVDITNPGGLLTKGADVPVSGQINNRWQIDEYAGVLRVVSQYNNGWSASGPVNPKVQTFTITNASTITPLATTDIQLPHPEQLNSVRFDGPRAYAISSERKDPLYTIDLSNPAAPKQAAALEMPGWIFYMEPRGDRLVGFGYDDTVGANARLAVSLFDVADLSKPALMSRVSFGDGWGTVAEDMDRIHKSVQVLDDAGLVLVPFASYGRWNGTGCSGPQSGIQLIDYSHDGLVLRGIAPQYGMPRRALLANNRLLGVSDRTVTSFDISSRDNPIKKNDLDLSTPAYRTVELPNHLAALSSDWWTGEIMLSLTPRTNPDDADVTGKVSLASLATPNSNYCNGSYGWTSWYEARLFANGNFVYLTVPVYNYDQNIHSGKVIVAAIDASDAAHPKLVGNVEMPLTERTNGYGYYGYGGFWDGYQYYSYYGGYVVGSGEGAVALGSKVAFLEIDNEYVERPGTDPRYGKRYDTIVHRKLHVADLSNPATPTAALPIELGESLGSSPLHLVNGVVMTTRWVKSPVHPGKVRFYLDRVDLNGSVPVQLSSINTPGSLLLADPSTGHLVTTDYTVARGPAADWQACQAMYGYRAYFDYDSKMCVEVSRAFKLSSLSGTHVNLLQSLAPPSQSIGGIAVTDDRIYVTHQTRYDYSQSCASTVGGTPCTPKILEQGGLWVLGGVHAGQLSMVSQLDGDAQWPLAVHGTKAALYTQGGLAIYDSSTPTATLVKEVNLRGYGYSSYVLLTDDHAVASLGEFGIQTVRY